MKRFARSMAAGPQIYVPQAQSPALAMWVAVRTAGNPAGAVELVRSAVRELDRNLPLLKVATMREVQSRSLHEERVLAWCLNGFAFFAAIIACTGIYGVMAWSVARRTYEIGVRIAVGASHGHVLGMVMGRALMLAGSGVALGLVLAAAAAVGLRSLLYGVGPFDPVVFVGVPAMLLAITMLAGAVPARRAARLDPTVALRAE